MTTLHVQAFGTGDRPVLAAHGLHSHGGRFRRIALDHLPTFTVHAVDLRGFGRSPWTPPWSVAQHVADLIATLDALGLTEVDLMGHSYGGFIVTSLAQAVPERVGRLVLLDPSLGLPAEVAAAGAQDALVDMSFTDVAQAWAMRAAVWPAVSAELIDTEIADHLMPCEDGRLRWRVNRAAAVTAFSELTRLRLMPPRPENTLLVRALRSRSIDTDSAEALRAAGVQVTEVDCGHNLLLEQPEPVGRAVREFLERERLWLRPVVETDLDALFEQQLDAEANRMAAFSATHPDDRDKFMTRWRALLAEPTVLARAIVFEGRVAGYVVRFIQNEKTSLAYWIDPAVWGRGVATRAVRAMLDEVTERPLYARVAADNVGSLRVLDKCGFVRDSTDRAHSDNRGQEVDQVIMRLE